jgi:hypothetical protein
MALTQSKWLFATYFVPEIEHTQSPKGKINEQYSVWDG